MDAKDYRRANLGIAEAIAPSWERRRPFIEAVSAPVREWMIRELAPRPGSTLLELAAGAGDTGFQAARMIGDTGRLISTDLSPAMLDAARRRGAQLGVTNVEYRVMDAEHMDLDTDSVDGVLCRFGYMLMAEPAAALSETRRVLRPGGRMALGVWGPPEENRFFSAIGMTLVERGHIPPPEPGSPGIFSMGDEDRTRALLKNAGFTEIRVETTPVRFAFKDIPEYLSIVADTAGPIAMVLRKLTGDELDAIGSRVKNRFAPFVSDGAYSVPGVALVAVAS